MPFTSPPAQNAFSPAPCAQRRAALAGAPPCARHNKPQAGGAGAGTTPPCAPHPAPLRARLEQDAGYPWVCVPLRVHLKQRLDHVGVERVQCARAVQHRNRRPLLPLVQHLRGRARAGSLRARRPCQSPGQGGQQRAAAPTSHSPELAWVAIAASAGLAPPGLPAAPGGQHPCSACDASRAAPLPPRSRREVSIQVPGASRCSSRAVCAGVPTLAPPDENYVLLPWERRVWRLRPAQVAPPRTLCAAGRQQLLFTCGDQQLRDTLRCTAG